MHPRSGPRPDAVAALADRVEQTTSGSPRFLLGIAGSPGSGKTTLATALVAELNARNPGAAAALPMDGFHLANATLDRLGRHDRKGAIDTFDGWGFLALLHRVRAETGHTVFAPSFRREVDEGVAGEIAIEPEAAWSSWRATTCSSRRPVGARARRTRRGVVLLRADAVARRASSSGTHGTA